MKAHHDCEINLKRDEILFIPGKGPLRTTLGVLRRSCMVSEKNRWSKKYLRSRASIVYEKRRHLRHYKYILHPFSLFRHCWDLAMMLSMYGMFIVLPYQASFDMYRNLNGWTIAKNSFIGLYILDIIVNFRTGYYDESLRIVQLQSRKIASRYISGMFFFDFLGSIPTDLFFAMHWNELIVSRELASLVMMFRFYSIYSYTKKLANSYDISVGIVNILLFIVMSLLLFHWQACIHYIVPMAVMSLGIPKTPTKDTWVTRPAMLKANSSSKYRMSVYRTVAIFTASGFDGPSPSTIEDQYVAIVSQILSAFIFCAMVGALTHIYKGMNSSMLKYRAMTVQLKQYMRHKHLSLESQQRFLSYYEFRYQNNYFRESEILNTVSAQINQEIGMHSCRKLVENVTFFNNLPMSILVRIVALLRSEIFLTNDVIVRANQPGDCMYFIASGTVAIYTKSGKEVCHLEDGAHFGEIALVMPDERRVASVVAVEICELYRLERGDFARTIHPYPMLWERIKKIAMERHERTTILNAQ